MKYEWDLEEFTDIVIADLSLHYFTEKTTIKILREIERIVKPEGILIFRVNSINDINYGSGIGIEIEKHLFETSDGRYKRFFDADDINKFFCKYIFLFSNEECMNRYEMPKQLWKCAVRMKNL